MGEGPYAFIELSSDSETEQAAQQAAAQTRAAGRPRRVETLAVHDRKLRECIAAADFAGALVELERMHGEARRDRSGPPLIFLHRLKALEEFVEAAPEKAEGAFRLLRAKLRRLFAEHHEALEGLDLSAAPLPVFDESQTLRSKAEPVVREEEEVDFAKRLKLSRDERRKFWQVKHKAPMRKEEERKKVVRQRTVRDKLTKEKVERFGHVALDAVSVTKRLKEWQMSRHQFKEDERDRAMAELEYVAQKGEGAWRWQALVLLAQLRLDAAVDDRFLTAEDISECVEDLNEALELTVEAEAVGGRAKALSGVVGRLDAEAQLAVCFAEPHTNQQRALLAASVQLLRLMHQLREAPGLEAAAAADLAFRELQHIFGWPADAVQRLDFYEPLFGSQRVDDVARGLAEEVSRGGNERQAAKAKLYLTACLALNGRDLHEAARMLHTQVDLSADRLAVCVHNRGVALLGLRLAAQGHLSAAKAALESLYRADLVAESLGQFDFAVSAPWDAVDPRALLPAHIHLPVEALNAAFLVCCLASETHLAVRGAELHPFFAKMVAEWQDKPASEPLHRAFELLQQLRGAAAAEEVQKVCPIPAEALLHAFNDETAACLIEQFREVGGTLSLDACAELLQTSRAVFAEKLNGQISSGELKAEVDDEFVRVEAAAAGDGEDRASFAARLAAFKELLSLLKGKPSAQPRSANLTAALQFYQRNFERRDKGALTKLAADTARPKVTFA